MAEPTATSAAASAQSTRFRWSLEWRLLLVLLLCITLSATTVIAVLRLPSAWWPLPTPVYLQQIGTVLLLLCGLLLLARRWLHTALYPIRSLGNVIDAVRLGDYSLRVRTDRPGIIRELATDINQLSASLSAQSQGVVESRALIEKLNTTLPLPWFVFDGEEVLRLANPAADRMLGSRPPDGITAATLGLDAVLQQPSGATVQIVLPGASGRYVVHQQAFRERGRRYRLLILVEVETALRSERQQAWESLVRVLAHEINNSLAPIKSIAETLGDMLHSDEISKAELEQQLQRIAHRASSLVRFVHNYASIARLPQPQMETVQIDELIRHCIDVQTGIEICSSGADLTIQADPVLLEQALINLLKNATDSSSQQHSTSHNADQNKQAAPIQVDWQYQTLHTQTGLNIRIVDSGTGLSATDNLFVPFYTTKPGGSGVGLLLTRRIAELHGGSLSLHNRDDGQQGAVAELWLPLRQLADG
ncbi:MAG: hypothetical protein KKC01_11995 [Gammaproteobacteria bacterium]|nr:hypothetical protein [Gammaproteobacteria bacterium]